MRARRTPAILRPAVTPEELEALRARNTERAREAARLLGPKAATAAGSKFVWSPDPTLLAKGEQAGLALGPAAPEQGRDPE